MLKNSSLFDYYGKQSEIVQKGDFC